MIHPSDGKEIFSRLHTGECTNTNSGFKVIDTNTPNIEINFEKNLNVFGKLNTNAVHCGAKAYVGNPPNTNNSKYVSFIHDYYHGSRTTDTNGDIIHWSNNDRKRISQFIADERPLQSMRAFLSLSPDKSSFLREDAFLAVILITDEMDGSSDSLNPCHSTGPGTCTGDRPEYIDGSGNRIFHGPSVYTDYLDNLKGSTDLYNMYAIAKPNHANKRAQLGNVAVASGGFKLDVDGEPSEYLDYLLDITGNIVEAATAFPLNCEPDVGTLSVVFHEPDGNGDYNRIEVPEDEGSGGWTYVPANQSIKFSESFFPGDGTRIFVDYTPIVLGCDTSG